MTRNYSGDMFSMAPISSSLIFLNVAMYCITAYHSANDFLPGGGSVMYSSPNVLNEMGSALRGPLWDGDYKRLFVPIILHGGVLHLLMNCYALYVLAPSAEVYFGRSNFLTIYILSGVGGVCASILMGGYVVGSVGASGAVFGILGAFLAVKIAQCPDLKRAMKNREVKYSAAMIVLFLFLSAVISRNTDNWGHVGGLFLGLLSGYLFEKWRQKGRLGNFTIILATFFYAGLIFITCRPTFLAHWQVHKGIQVLKNDNLGEANKYFQKAFVLAKWQSHKPIYIAIVDAIEELEEEKRSLDTQGKVSEANSMQFKIDKLNSLIGQ